MKDKMSYSWRQIVRFLSANDKKGEGCVPISVFNEALNHTKTFMSKQEIESIVKQFGNPIDYTRISEELMGHTDQKKKQQLQQMRNTHS